MSDVSWIDAAAEEVCAANYKTLKDAEVKFFTDQPLGFWQSMYPLSQERIAEIIQRHYAVQTNSARKSSEFSGSDEENQAGIKPGWRFPYKAPV